jgi:hypothetical protein
MRKLTVVYLHADSDMNWGVLGWEDEMKGVISLNG